MSAKVYVVTNLLTGKEYVGATIQDVAQRWRCHKASCKRRASALWRDMDDFGADNFCIRILEDDLTEDQMRDAEIYWIAKMNTLAPSGYNIQTGGRRGFRGARHTRKTKAQLRLCRSKPVAVEDTRGVTRRIFASHSAAGEFLGVGRTRISNHIKSGRALMRNRWKIYNHVS